MPIRRSRVVTPGALAGLSGSPVSRVPARGFTPCDHAGSRGTSALATLHPIACSARRRFISILPTAKRRHDLVGVQQGDEPVSAPQEAESTRHVGLVGGIADLEDVVECLEA